MPNAYTKSEQLHKSLEIFYRHKVQLPLGQCVSLLYRIVTDRDTGKQKGFAFLEYFDTQTAESAIRNLNEFDLNGRKLKVHFAANDMDSKLRTGQGKGVS